MANSWKDYNRHLLDQWLDRQVDWRYATMSGQCAQAVLLGQELSSLEGKLSVMLVREDGVDQAKFKCPRKLVKGHTWDKLYRPALHVHGIWAHGWGFHFAISDADMPKGTNSNVEIMARMLESVYRKTGALPQALIWIQDNTSRECKNSKIMKFCIMLKVLDVFKHVYLGYPVKGHTHGPLDATFGQCCVKMANAEFDTPSQVVDLLQDFLDNSQFEHLANENKQAYKLDESANWENWWNQIPLQMSDLTGPNAPHLFHVCQRRDLGADDVNGTATKWVGAPEPHLDDVVLAVKSRLSSICAHQVALILPAVELNQLQNNILKQPVGIFPRRSFSDQLRVQIVRTAESVFDQGSLNQAAFDYLKAWGSSTARREPRPQSYTFLNHKASKRIYAKQTAFTPSMVNSVRPITVLRSNDPRSAVGRVQTLEQESCQDVEPPMDIHLDL
jgi:hypothetical protein